MKGKKNAYSCSGCGNLIITIDLDEGVTPFSISCLETGTKCKAPMFSAMYQVDQTLRPTHQWYKPSKQETSFMSLGMQEHIKMGGLALRKVLEGTA